MATKNELLKENAKLRAQIVDHRKLIDGFRRETVWEKIKRSLDCGCHNDFPK